MNYINLETRTAKLRELKEGESTLIAPYNGHSYARECASIKSVGVREGILFIVKKALIVIEGEVTYSMIRVTHGGITNKKQD